jgi:hypothetical protein
VATFDAVHGANILGWRGLCVVFFGRFDLEGLT